MQIKRLDSTTYDTALVLRNTVFPLLEPLEDETLAASLEPKKFIKWYRQAQIRDLRYWVTVNEHNHVIGLVGLYTQDGDKKSKVWLGWYCVDPAYRGLRVGSRSLDFVIEQAREENFAELHLYTTKDDVYHKARILYEQKGFQKYKETKKGNTLYYKLFL